MTDERRTENPKGETPPNRDKPVVEFKWLVAQHVPNVTSPEKIELDGRTFYAHLKPVLTRSHIVSVVHRRKTGKDVIHLAEFYFGESGLERLSEYLKDRERAELGTFVNGTCSSSCVLVERVLPDDATLMTAPGSEDWIARIVDSFAGQAAISRATDSSMTPLEITGHRDHVSDFAWTPDGRWLLTGSADKTARLWEFRSGREPTSVVLEGHARRVPSVAISADGRRAVTGSYDGSARVWDTTTRKSIVLPAGLSGSGGAHPYPINVVAISPNGRWVVTGDFRMTALLWDMDATTPEKSAKLLERRETLHWNYEGRSEFPWVAISPGGRWAATGSGDGVATLWDLRAEDPAASPITLAGHDSSMVNRVVFSPDGRWVATGGWGESARVWDLEARDPSTSSLVVPLRGAHLDSVAFSPDSRWVAMGTDWSVRLWDLESKTPTRKPVELFGHTRDINDIAFSPSGRWIATASRDHTVRLWNRESSPQGRSSVVLSVNEGNLEDTRPSWLPHGVTTLGFTADNRLVTGRNDGTIQLWDPPTDGPEIGKLKDALKKQQEAKGAEVADEDVAAAHAWAKKKLAVTRSYMPLGHRRNG